MASMQKAMYSNKSLRDTRRCDSNILSFERTAQQVLATTKKLDHRELNTKLLLRSTTLHGKEAHNS